MTPKASWRAAEEWDGEEWGDSRWHLEATMEGQVTASPENHAGGPLLVWD